METSLSRQSLALALTAKLKTNRRKYINKTQKESTKQTDPT